MSRVNIVKKLEKYLNPFIALLVLTALVLFLRLLSQKMVLTDFIPQPTPKETPRLWGRNRDFPPDFTEEEKIVLTEQFHDYERVTPAMDEEYLRFLDLLKTYVSYDPNLEVIIYKDDCFGRPVVLGVKDGQSVTIRNNNEVGVNMGVGGEDWFISAFSEVVVYPKLIEEVENQYVWGYACGDKGMAGYFTRAN